VKGSCEHGNEPAGSVKCREIELAARMVASQERLSSMKLVSYRLFRQVEASI
jgi:hypothetical protein